MNQEPPGEPGPPAGQPPEPPGPPQQPQQPPQWQPQQQPYAGGQWGYPPPGGPTWAPQSGPPPQPRSTNGFAIAALIFGLIGGAIFSVVFGFIALRQIRRTGQDGRGMAITGLILSALWFAVAAGVIALISSGAFDDFAKNFETSSQRVDVNELAAGECVNGLQAGRVETVQRVPCTDPHQAEAFAVFYLDPGEWPGEEAVTRAAEEGCVTRMQTSFPEAYEDRSIGVFFFHPSISTWRLDDRKVTCLAEYTDGPREGFL